MKPDRVDIAWLLTEMDDETRRLISEALILTS
jgi:hypothetical protein